MEKLYRLEFNEKSQHLRLDNYTHEENTHGWKTVCNSISDNEFHILESYISSQGKIKLTVNYLIKSIKHLERFILLLSDYNLHIKK
jgi:hypothetical protein